jgi:hypothetical protein
LARDRRRAAMIELLGEDGMLTALINMPFTL